MSDKNLIICFSSIRPSNYPLDKLKDRESNYNLSLKWLLKSLPSNWDIIYNDNTISSLDDIENDELRESLSNLNVILHNNNIGSLNKGAGEHDMCKKSFSTINPKDYKWVTYFTARHIIPNSWYFDNLENKYDNYDAVMSNPSFHYLSYQYAKSDKNLYNDMLFSMKSDVFQDFISSIDTNNLIIKHKNSETHLFEFVNDKKINKIELDSLGILRNDWQSFGWHLV
jgi:hypothetical protein